MKTYKEFINEALPDDRDFYSFKKTRFTRDVKAKALEDRAKHYLKKAGVTNPKEVEAYLKSYRGYALADMIGSAVIEPRIIDTIKRNTRSPNAHSVVKGGR